MRQIVLIVFICMLTTSALSYNRIEPEEQEYDRQETCEESEDTMELNKEERRLVSVALGLFLQNKGVVNHIVSFTERQEKILLKIAEELKDKR
jgi:hypothetical protein